MNLWKQQKPSFCILIRKVSDIAETMAALKSSTHNSLKWLPDVCVSSLTSNIVYQVQSVLHSCFSHHQKSFQLTGNLETHIHALLTLHYFQYSCLQECNTTKAIESPLSIFTISSMIYGLISSLSFFQNPLLLDFFQRCSINTVILKLSTIHFPSSQVLCAVNCSIKGLCRLRSGEQ